MTVQRVAIPVFRGKRRFHVLKGRPWSPAEHLILQGVANKPRTAADLSAAAALPRRVVVEMLIRLMRVGWVEISPRPDGAIFQATPAGKERATGDELPAAQKTLKRWMSFFIDRVTGSHYRGREFQSYPKSKLEERTKGESVIWLAANELDPEPKDFLSCLTGDDEQIVGIEPNNERLSELYALVTVRDGRVEGLPTRAPPRLTAAILKDIKKTTTAAEASAQENTNAGELQDLPQGPRIFDAVFSQDDLILGAEAHQKAFLQAIKRAKSRLIIHSTFISENSLRDALPALKEAAHRSVRIDVFWGQSEDNKKTAATMDLLRAVKAELESAGLDGLLKLHLFSTQSHSKLIVADDLSTGRFFGIVGSCNWLYTTFQSFDASVRVRDPAMVSELLNVLAKLSRGRECHWLPITEELARLSIEVAGQKAPTGTRVKASLVLGSDHGHFVRMARDEAKKRIFVGSHRLSDVANRAVVLPAMAAVENSKGALAGRIYYCTVSGGMTQTEARALAEEAMKKAVKITPVHIPTLHAKVLAWDDDSVVITSLNWLSADSPPNQPLREVGIYFTAKRAADVLIRTFDNAHLG